MDYWVCHIKYNIISKEGKFDFFFADSAAFCFSWGLIADTRTSSTMLNSSGVVDIPAMFLTLGEKLSVFPH